MPLHIYFDKETYDLCIKQLPNGKAQGPYDILNSILKNMPSKFQNLLDFYSSNTATNNNKYRFLGKLDLHFIYKKR